jgi:hypothetical protein
MIFGIALLSIPYLKYEHDTGGIWFASRVGRKVAILAMLIPLVITPVLILLDQKSMAPNQELTGVTSFLISGLLPLILLIVITGCFFWFIKLRYSAGKNETVQAIFILFLTAFMVLTLTNIWFRGEGMQLSVPW